MDPWLEIDELILARKMLLAIQEIRTQPRVPLRDAIEILDERFRWLQVMRPQDFQEAPAGYETYN